MPSSSPFDRWETVRYELLNRRICDLGLKIRGSPVEPFVERLRREFAAKGFRFRPLVYLTDSWGCPDRVPAMGVPFYLADKRLTRIEEEQTGEIEDDLTVMMLLRHEAGHAVNYAYGLWKEPGWTELFGPFTKPYRETFTPQPGSQRFVRHLFSAQHGHTYAQKHPDEDFAETFAVWLTPRSAWRRRYRFWPAFRKLTYVDELMRTIRRRAPGRTRGKLLNPVEELNMLLVEHYGQRAEKFRAAAQGYVDDKLRIVFPPARGASTLPAVALFRKHREELLARIVRWSDLDEDEASRILDKLEGRAAALRSRFPRGQIRQKLMDIASLATALAMEFAYTGRLMA